MKVLVMACHADDEVLGCGGVICKHLEEGDEVHVLVVTEPRDDEEFGWNDKFRENKLKEQAEVDELLGIKHRHFLRYSVMDPNASGKFNHAIQLKINEIDPDVVYTHWHEDLNYQHRLVSLATLIAVRPPKKIVVYMYEMESSRFSTRAFKPNHYVDISKYIGKKCRAFELYKTEYRNDAHPRNSRGITVHSQYRGHEVGLEHAEAFRLVKEVVK